MDPARILREAQAKQAAANKPLPLLNWTLQNRPMLIPDRPFSLASHPYLAGIYEAQARRMIVYKSGQMGISEYLLSYALHACDQRRANVLYTFPNDALVSDFSSARLGPAIEASDYLNQIVVEGGGGEGKRGADRVTLKRIRNRFLYFRGAVVKPSGLAPQLKSIDADVLILDELDEMDPRAPSIARKRLGHSMIAEERAISTPTYPERGIHAEWLHSDQREWHVQCGRCGNRQTITINDVVIERDALDRPTRWHKNQHGAFAACRKCGREIDRLGTGEWVAIYPSRETVGFHVTKLFSGAASLDGLIKALQTTDETKRREAYNQDLGEPYTPRGGQLTDEVLNVCRRDYVHGVPPRNAVDAEAYKSAPVMGIDVGRVLHSVIRTFNPETGERRQIWCGELSWDELIPTMRRFGVQTDVIDALPETTKAREAQAALPPGTLWLSYYPNQALGSKDKDAINIKFDEGTVLQDRTRTLDTTFAMFVDSVNTLPANAADIRDYYAHLKASVRVLETNKQGEMVARYVETGPDHYAHAENYCSAARFVAGQRGGIGGSGVYL